MPKARDNPANDGGQLRRAGSDYRSLDETRTMLATDWRIPGRGVHWINHARALCRISGLGRDWADDLLHETYVRIGEGRRQWPKDVDWNAFFHATMRSIVSNLRELESRSGPLGDLDRIASNDDVERAAFFRQLDARIVGALEGEVQLRQFHAYRCSELNLAEIGRRMGLGADSLEATRKKYMRRVRNCIAGMIAGQDK